MKERRNGTRRYVREIVSSMEEEFMARDIIKGMLDRGLKQIPTTRELSNYLAEIEYLENDRASGTWKVVPIGGEA